MLELAKRCPTLFVLEKAELMCCIAASHWEATQYRSSDVVRLFCQRIIMSKKNSVNFSVLTSALLMERRVM